MSTPKGFPTCCAGGIDPLQHKTISDFVRLVQHELDMYEEGEETDIQTAKQLAECKRFIKQGSTR